MFTPKANLLSGRRGGSRSNTPLSGSRRTPLLSTRAKGSTPLARTNVIEDTGVHILASFGSSLPVLVIEVLTLASAGEVTVSLGENGWAWLVSGRRLVVWRYSGGGRAQCRELSLPPSDLTHRSGLCAVYSLTPGQTPCCLAVSPEGVVRYWPSIVHEGSSTETSTELGGQECFSLTSILPAGCILATTTSTLVLIHHAGQGVSCKHLQTSSNLLGGFSRRVSSLLWGSMGGVQGEARLIKVVGTVGRDTDTRVVIVLTASGLQKWMVEDGETYKQIYDADMTDIARESMWRQLEKDGAEGKPSWLKVWTLDISIVGEENLVILVAGVNSNENVSQGASFRVYYSLLTIKIITDAPPMRAEGCVLLPHTNFIAEGEDPAGMEMMCVGGICFLLSGQIILPVNIQSGEQLPKISLSSGDSVLGTGDNGEFPLLFTIPYGVLSITPTQGGMRNESLNLTDNLLDKSSSKLSDSLNISVSAQGLETLTMSESKTDQLKAAFLLFCKRSKGQAEAIIQELFPEEHVEQLDSALDRLVLSLSKDLIDDFPASDPRWMESVPASQASRTGASMSLLVLQQLEDKLACHDLYISFLKSVGLWNRLSAVTVRGKPMPTALSLSEHNEKNIAAVTLRSIHMDHIKMMDVCMKSSLDDRNITASGSLTSQDHFYREISRIDDILDSFVNNIQHSIRCESPSELLKSIVSVNTLVINMLKAVLSSRNKRMGEYTTTGFAASLEYYPWTAERRSQLSALLKLSISHGYKSAEDAAERVRIGQQILDLADIILDGYRSQVYSVDGEQRQVLNAEYIREREQLIQPLVDLKLYDQAASLAEKYLEFSALVRICEETGNKDKLDEYISEYSEHNFSEFVFSWYMKEGKQSRLLASTGSSKELGRFLTGHSDISWLHDFHTNNFNNAASTLLQAASNETDLLERKKVELSLAKLAALAGEEDFEDVFPQIEQEVMLVKSQEQLPVSVIEQFGLDHNNMRVLTPREMIEMYIGEENRSADSLEFIKALDLLNYVQLDQDEKERVRLHIWCQSILRNSWSDIDTDNPIESVKETVFFKIVEYAFHQGLDLSSFLTTPEIILEQAELGNLRHEKNFQYLLKTGYEHVLRACGE
ncbi:nuclear pore complex protein Nup133 [Eurytemora carolleeae]|uniref:nuclear pore complex protein Nup133 n=1 Tax=Eurytemora carolleeae TaxID=1294199 RepID=UPI000C75A49F|nr:nuclear pore complex protein Nup133 [Eurytemora carolleeae]|eukprot:XP_023336022.1 nuclear pore complex protein Nup133-like [Eurytemora affinis]